MRALFMLRVRADGRASSTLSGSHRAGTLNAVESGDGDAHRKIEWEPEDFLPLTMEPGDCVTFSRLTIHGSGVNSARSRGSRMRSSFIART